MASALTGLSRRQHAAEEAWARELQELAAAAHRTRLDGLGAAGAERLARAAAPAAAPAASMLPAIAAQYLRLGTPQQVRARTRAARALPARESRQPPVPACRARGRAAAPDGRAARRTAPHARRRLSAA